VIKKNGLKKIVGMGPIFWEKITPPPPPPPNLRGD